MDASCRAFACRHVLRQERPEPILRVYFELDGDVQVLCWGDHDDPAGGALVHLAHVLARDPSVVDAVRDLQPGQVAWRERPGSPWIVEAIPDDAPAAPVEAAGAPA